MLSFGVTRLLPFLIQWHPHELTDVKIEYLVVALDDEHKKVRLSLRQAEILTALAHDAELCKDGGVVPEMQKQYVDCSPIALD
jgi:hypothetical protein